jgi:hypothetical protein
VGDLPKPSDDAAWTEVERSFFAAAPPEEAQPLGEASSGEDLSAPRPRRPRRAIIASLRPAVVSAQRGAALVLSAAGGLAQRTWRRTALIVGAAVAHAWHAARAGAANVVAALSNRPVDRHRLAFAVAALIMAAGLSAGVVPFRKGALPKGATLAEASPGAVSPSQAAPRPDERSSVDVQASRVDVSSRRPHPHRRAVPPSSSSRRPQLSAFMDRETFWARENRSAPVRSSRPFFSR